MNTHNLKILLLPMLALAAIGNAAAQNLYWNPPSGTSWSTTDVNWSTTEVDPASQAWPGGSGVSNAAAFGGAGGSVSVEENLSAGGLRFNSDGYTISASGARTLTLTGANPLINVDTEKTATLGSNVQILSDSKKFTKTGSGTLNITASSGSPYFGTGGVSSGSELIVQEGTLLVSGTALQNTQTTITIDGGANMVLNQLINIGGISGSGEIGNASLTNRGLMIRGVNANFSGVISGNIYIDKLNGTAAQTLSGSESNTFTGSFAVRVGTMILAKENGAIAVSGNEIILGTPAAVASQLRLDGDEQIANTTNLAFRENNQATVTFNLNGHSETLGSLTGNTLGTGGQNVIDYGINDFAQILTFQSLSAPGVIKIINFGVDLDELRFINDPTSQLGNVFINDQAAYATDFGTYWGVVPEPSTLLLLMMGFLFVLWRPRRRLSRFGRLG